MRRVQRLLIVEDSRALSSALRAALTPTVEEISTAHSLAEARSELRARTPDAIILDVHLPDGESTELLDEIRALRPLPHVVALSGTARADQAFQLAQAGVRAFVPKPLDLERFEKVWLETLSKPAELEAALRSTVGHVPMATVQETVRGALLDEALARSGGSRRGAAKLLSISRQLLQYLLGRR